MVVSEDGGSNFVESGYASFSVKTLLSYGSSIGTINSTAAEQFDVWYTSRESLGYIFINNSDNLFQYNGEGITNDSSSPTIYLGRNYMGGRILTSESRVNTIRIYRGSSDNFVSGEIRLYGYKETI